MASRSAREMVRRMTIQIDSLKALPVIRYSRTGNIKAVVIKEASRLLGDSLPELTNADWTLLGREGLMSTVLFLNLNVVTYKILKPVTRGYIRFFSQTRDLRTTAGLDPLNRFVRNNLFADFKVIFKKRLGGNDEIEKDKKAEELALKLKRNMRLHTAFTKIAPGSIPVRSFYQDAKLRLKIRAQEKGRRFSEGTMLFDAPDAVTSHINRIANKLAEDELFIQNLADASALEGTVERSITQIMEDFLRGKPGISIKNEEVAPRTLAALKILKGRAGNLIGPAINASKPGPLPSSSTQTATERIEGASSLNSIKNEINRTLYAATKKHMGVASTYKRKQSGLDPLVYRTGRFARTSRVVSITPVKGFKDKVNFRYKLPYKDFEFPHGGNPKLATPGRDPRALLRRAIQSILIRMLGKYGLQNFQVDKTTGKAGGV